jgi:hypothetical protein
MYLNCNYPIFTDFFIVKTTQTIQYANYNQYYYGDLDFKLNNLKNIHIDITSQCSNIFKLSENHEIKAANKLFKLFIWKSALFYYTKIKFTGKGYKIKKIKKKESLKFYFGRSHFNYIFGGGLNLKKLSKYRLLVISNNNKKSNIITKIVCSVRCLNKFTKRGLRPLKYFVLKRPGKKTNY